MYGEGNVYDAVYGLSDKTGQGNGYGNLDAFEEFMSVSGKLTAQKALSLSNAELRRIAIEKLGPDAFFEQSDGTIIDSDTDAHGHPRKLIRVPVRDTERGYLQALRVVCPTTLRVYYLHVPSTMTNCQDAAASLFGMKGSEYRPIRET
jgi:hypothetical protein